MTIELRHIPMPPSSNAAYPTIMVAGRPRRVKSATLRVFERDMANWALSTGSLLRQASALMLEQGERAVFRLDATFWFQREHVLTKRGTPKRNDVSNRLKALHDALCAMLEVDDSVIWAGTFEKRILPADQPESVDVKISPWSP